MDEFEEDLGIFDDDAADCTLLEEVEKNSKHIRGKGTGCLSALILYIICCTCVLVWFV